MLDSSLVLSSSSSSMDGCGTRRHDKNRGKFKKEEPKSYHMSYTNLRIQVLSGSIARKIGEGVSKGRSHIHKFPRPLKTSMSKA